MKTIYPRHKVKDGSRSWTEKAFTGGTESRNPGADVRHQDNPGEKARRLERNHKINGS